MIPMVMTIIAKTESFQREMAKTSASVGSLDKRFATSAAAVGRFGKTILALAGIGGGIYALKRGLTAITTAAIEQEKAEKALEAALGHSIGTFKQYASSIQRLTIYDNEAILTQMAYARNLGVTENRLKEATRAAIGLAAKYKIDLQSAMMLIGRASQGQTATLTRYGIVLDDTLTTSEKFNEILRIGADAFGLAEAEAKTASGTFAQFKNEMGNLAATMGDYVLPSLTKITRELTNLISDREKISRGWENIRFGFTEGFIRMFGRPEDIAAWTQALNDYNREAGYWAKTGIGTEVPVDLDRFKALLDNARGIPGTFMGGGGGRFGGKGIGGEWWETPLISMIGLTDEDIEEMSKGQDKINQITMKMYADMGDYGIEYRELQKVLLESQVDEYRQMSIDETVIAEWKTSEIEKNEKELAESIKKAREENQNAAERWISHYGDMGNIWDEMAEDSARGLDSLANTLTEFETTGKADWRQFMAALLSDYLTTLNKMIIATATTNIINPLINSLISGLVGGVSNAATGAGGYAGTAGGGPTGGASRSMIMHQGGIVGEDSFPIRMLSASYFARAPRLHSGLRSDEYAAVLQRGETVVPKNAGGAGNIKVVLVYDMKQAQLEAMNSAEGEKVIVQKIARNRRILG